MIGVHGESNLCSAIIRHALVQRSQEHPRLYSLKVCTFNFSLESIFVSGSVEEQDGAIQAVRINSVQSTLEQPSIIFSKHISKQREAKSKRRFLNAQIFNHLKKLSIRRYIEENDVQRRVWLAFFVSFHIYISVHKWRIGIICSCLSLIEWSCGMRLIDSSHCPLDIASVPVNNRFHYEFHRLGDAVFVARRHCDGACEFLAIRHLTLKLGAQEGHGLCSICAFILRKKILQRMRFQHIDEEVLREMVI